MMRRWFLALLAAMMFAAPAVAAGATGQAGRFVFSGWDGPPLPVFYQLPETVTPDTRVVFIMHGVNRDADRYRDEWAAHARRLGFIVIAPQFAAADFPGSLGYNTGYFTEEDGTARPRSRWSFAAIEPLFDDVRQRFGTRVERYAIYGHSAGAQFVHRYVLFMPEARIDRAIAANAGWYTMPDSGTAFPYGLGATPIGAEGLAAALGKPLMVLLGTADTDRADPDLRKTPEADAQGPHRYARGQAFFARGEAAAAAAGVPFAWQLERVPGIAHSNAGMAEAAAALIAGR
ncbi:alpha/beta hydrolase [Erythrobacter sp. CCH5-A1]|jgi:poly(3-hydroxybutyrate) depolymerase|uniref:alpha/beta hydrolase n=1 Tax=Erythrobacter sp. CCH5-A1 TaxID=1768792 RepID=UPI0008304D9C|nr:alpha/beta hydrolase [Erythrobacter sp. CCH5-A1]